MSDSEVMTTAIVAALYHGGNFEKARAHLQEIDAGAISQAEADAWLAEQELRVQTGRFIYFMPFFLVSALRP